MKIAQQVLFIVTCSLVAIGCGSDPKPEPQAPTPPPAEAPPAAESPKPQDDGSRGNIRISADILKACGISDADANFGFDSAQIQSGDQPTLNKLSECFTTGPLKGRQMRLVGHADPRGEEEYNMVLGGRRADNVKSYLVGRGLPDQQAETTSRGEMDAKGTDDSSWSEDRRVDIVLAN
jgi:peptidoglycan-associated lipoprotein